MLHIFSLFLLWFVGCCLGSFFMVIGTRIPIHQSIIVPRSHCPNCQIPLHPYQLVPLISYFVQKGRCVTCRIKIPFLYPIIEGLSGFCYLVAYLNFGHSPTQFRIILLLISFSLIFIVSDIFYQLLPDSIMFCFFCLTILVQIRNFPTHFLGGFSLFSLFFLVAYLSPDGLGGGDIKLAGVLGWLLGFKLGLLAILLACLAGFTYFLFLFNYKQADLTTKVPFAPFILFGALIAYFVTNQSSLAAIF